MPLAARAPLLLLLALLAGVRPASAEEAPAPAQVAWAADLPSGLVAAKEAGRLLMVCVNARHVEGREEEEPAAKGLREIVYRDPRIVERSRDFVCVLLTKEGSSAEYDALRELGIDGRIVSPQHVFVSAQGDRIVHRKEYWPHGSGEPAVQALLELMRKAEEAAKRPSEQAPGDALPEAPPSGEARAAWIAQRIAEVGGELGVRNRALEALVEADREGDCTTPLIALLPVHDEDASTLRAIVRALGRDGLEAAALPLAELLRHDEATVRANAAVSLEYVGSRDKKVIAALQRLGSKEKDEGIANHAWRALGRCGAGDAKVRGQLLDEASGAKSEFASYGPLIGLAYFEGDEKAMRGVEKLLKQLGIPGSRRGAGQDAVRRGIASWTLASIGDPKSAAFVREELVAGLEHVKAFWVDGLRSFWRTTAEVCDGQKGRLGEVEEGVRRIAGFARNGRGDRPAEEFPVLDDEARKGRVAAGFKPKGDGLLGDAGE